MTDDEKKVLAYLMGLNAGVHQHLSKLPQTPLIKAALNRLEEAHRVLNDELNTEIIES